MFQICQNDSAGLDDVPVACMRCLVCVAIKSARSVLQHIDRVVMQRRIFGMFHGVIAHVNVFNPASNRRRALQAA